MLEHIDFLAKCSESKYELEECLSKLKQESGINEDVAYMANLIVMSADDVFKKFGHNSSGLCFPYPSLRFNDYGKSFRIRFDRPKKDLNNGKEQRYSQPPSSSTSLYLLLQDIEKIKNRFIPLIITEGEKKHLSLKSHLNEFAIISMPGCYGYMKEGEVSDEYDLIPFENREVYFVGDSDFRTNRNVFNGYVKLIKYLISKKAKVFLVDLSVEGKFKKYGADDFIVEFGIEELKKRMSLPILVLEPIDSLITKELSSNEFFLRVSCDTEENFARHENGIKIKYDKSGLNFKKLIKHGSLQLEKLCNPDDEIIFSDTLENNNQFIINACSKIRKKHVLYLLRNTLVIVDFKNSKFTILSNFFLLKGFMRSVLNVKKLTRQFDYKYFPLQDEFIEQVFYNPQKYFLGIEEIGSIINLPYVFSEDDKFLNGVFNEICHIGNSSNGLTTFNRENSPLFKVLNYLPFKTREDCCDFLGFLIGLFFVPYHLGSHPMIILKGDGPGVSKSTLAEIIDILLNEVFSGSIAFKSSEEELEKQFATKILKSSVVIIDNMRSSRSISSPLLEKCATDPVLSFRQLGSQKSIERPNDCIFILTLNGGTFSEDILDRSIVIELSHENKSKLPFEFNGLISEFVKEHKREIIRELGTMIKVAHNGSKSYRPIEGMHRFNSWANKVNHVMTFNGFSFLNSHKTKKMSNDPLLVSLVRLSTEPMKDAVYELGRLQGFTLDRFFFDEAKSSSEILEEIKIRKLEQQDDLSVAMLGKQLQRLSKQNKPRVEYEDTLYDLSVECLKSTKGGNNKTYKVQAVPVEAS